MNENSLDDTIIRWYRADDFEAVETLVRNLARLFGDSFDNRWFKMYMEKRLLETVPGCYVASCKDKGIVGSVFCDVMRDPTGAQYGYISNIMVRDECRGLGIGEKLLKKAIDFLIITGVPRIWANVREETKAMVHLFEKNKFEKKFSTFELKTPPFGI
ncbi:MAG: GNAT family N-acetyltransferase [Promethearchaeota archaeon]